MNGKVGSKVTAGDDYKAIELPYGCTNFTMVVIVPDETLASFNTLFTAEMWNAITSTFDEQKEYGEKIVYMPKFKFSYEKILNDHFKAGMIDAFNSVWRIFREFPMLQFCRFVKRIPLWKR
jgi:serine protease inhibitor